MPDRYTRAEATVRLEHVPSLQQTATGWTWGCSCGSKGRGRARTAAIANAALNRHRRAAWKRALRG